MNAIYILWLRQLKRQVRAKSRLIGSLGQPILFLFALGFGFGPIFEKAGGGNYIQFIAPGIIAMGIIFNATISGIEVIWDKQFGFLKETLVAPVSRFNIMFGRALGGATIATVQGIVVLLITLIAGFRPTNWFGLVPAICFMFLIGLLFSAIGTAIGSTLEDVQGFGLILNFFVLPVFFLSGAIFPLTNLSSFVTILTEINPLTYGVDGIRGALLGNAHFMLSTDAIVLCLVTAACVGIGSWLFARIRV